MKKQSLERGRRSRRPRRVGLACERLESRALLAVTALLSNGQLSITVTAADTATLSYDGTDYTVSGVAGSFAASSVTSIVANQGDTKANTFSVADALTDPSLDYFQANFTNGTVSIASSITCNGSSSNAVQFLGAAITLSGNISAGTSLLTFDGPVTLGADVTLATLGQVISFTDTLDGAYVLTCETNFGGQVNFGGKVGAGTALAGLSILSGGATQSPGATIALDGSGPGSAPNGITVATGCENVLFTEGGTIENFTGSGIVLQGSGAAGVTTAEFNSFTLANNGADGIDVQEGTHSTVTITGNTINGNARNGVTLENQSDSSSVSVTNNTITALRTGVYLSGSFTSATIEKNVIDFAAAANPSISYGILYAPTVAGAVVIGSMGSGNTVTGAGTGIYLTGTLDNASVQGNTLKNCGSGITLVAASSPTTPLSVASNTIDGTKQGSSTITSLFGIYMDNATGVTVGGSKMGNTIKNGTYGIYATGDCFDTTVQGNTIAAIDANTGVALTLAAAQNLTVGVAGSGTGNTIEKARQAVYATGDLTGTLFHANTVQDALVGMVLANATNLTVGGGNGNGNTFQATDPARPFFIGIYAQDACTATTIEANTLTNKANPASQLGQGFGIYLSQATDLTIGGVNSGGVTLGNTLAGFYSGVTASGSLTSTTLQGNIVGGTGTVIGLELNAATSLAVGLANTPNDTYGNTFYDALAFGVYATGLCTGTTLTSNYLTRNGYGLYAFGAASLSLDGNYVYSNSVSGITLDGADATDNVILSNTIYANPTSGISLVNGANAGVAAPVLTTATATTVTGTLSGTNGQTYRIQYFTNPAILTPSPSSAEGRSLLTLSDGNNFQDVTISGTSASVNATFDVGSPNNAIANGDYVTATATLISDGTPTATSAFSAGVQFGTPSAPLAVTFDATSVSGLLPSQIYVSIQPGGGPGGLSGFIVTYKKNGQDILVPFDRPDYVISEPLSLADITDTTTSSSPTLYVTQGVSISTYVSFGAPLVPSTTAPSVISTVDPNYTVRFQQFELTRNDPAVISDQGNLTHINYFTAPMKLENFARSDITLSNPLQTKSFGTNTATGVYNLLKVIPTQGGGTIESSSAVVSDKSGVVRVIGPSTFTSNLPYPSLLPYVQTLAGTTTKIWNYNGFENADATVSYQINFGPRAYDSTSGSYNDATNSLTMSVDASGVIRVYGSITLTKTGTQGPAAPASYVADASSPWMVISPGSGTGTDLDNYNLAIYGQANTEAVTYPNTQWNDIEAFLTSNGANFNADPLTTTQGLLIGDVTSALLLGFANAAPAAGPFAPFAGTIYPTGYPNAPTITYTASPIQIKDMRSREWWNFDPTSTPTAQLLQPTNAYYNQYAAVIQKASSNQTYTIPYSDRLGNGPLIQTVQYQGTDIGTIKVTLSAPISLPSLS